jgi:hypothetical protein
MPALSATSPGVAVSETGRCPCCGSPVREPGGIEGLYQEVRRIRELAESDVAQGQAARIADLTRQVQELRATVARLRAPGPARSAPPRDLPDRRAG